VTTVLDIAVPLLAGLSIVLALFFAYRWLRSKSRHSRASFGVAQQEARLAMRVEFVRGITAALVGLILFALVGLSARPPNEAPVPSATPATSTPEVRVTATTTSTATIPPVAIEATAGTPALLSPTAPPTATTSEVTNTPIPLPATETPTAEPETAIVTSEIGVWLRATPSTEGEQMEWVLQGTTLILLPGLETADDFDWQQVRTPDGNEGWVAVPCIQYNQ